MFDNLYKAAKLRYGGTSATDSMGQWICDNTTIKKRPFSFEGYEFQRAIADDMHRDVSVIKCSQVGLALALDTPIVTPTGWTTMGEVEVGDQLFDEQGQVTEVTYKSPIYTDHVCYRITFDDGEQIVADAGHRWYVESDRLFGVDGAVAGQGRRSKSAGLFKAGVITTAAIAREFKRGGRHLFSIPNTKPLTGTPWIPPIDPYFLGLWLGDGSLNMSVITTHESDKEPLKAELGRRGLTCLDTQAKGSVRQFKVHFHDQIPGSGKHKNQHSTSSELRKLGLLGHSKFIPQEYLRADEEVRLDLVRGLMDSDGCIATDGQAYFVNTSPALIDGMSELLRSLGFKPHVKWVASQRRSVLGRPEIDTKPLGTISFKAYSNDPAICLLPRKRIRLQEAIKAQSKGPKSRKIINVQLVDTIPVQCLSVNSPSHLFLAGKGMIPTHNTEVQIRKFLALLTRGNSLNGIFSLPSEKLFTKIYQGRIKPIVEGDQIFNPETGHTPVRRKDQIQIRDSFGYITGCGQDDATAISSDFLFHDEVDLSPQDILSLYQSRVQNSDMQITQRFSTPSFMGFGIDKFNKMTDQREYVVRCSACNHYQIPRVTSDFIKIPFEVESFYDLTPEQIGMFDYDELFVKCEHCHRPLDLTNPDLREWVATYPTRQNARGYHVRPFSTSRLKPRYIFSQLAKHIEAGTPRHFANTVLGEPYTDANAEIQRGDVEKCMKGAQIPTISSTTPVYMGIDVGFSCYITLHIEDDNGLPEFVLFEIVPHSHLETRVGELRRIYTIVQGAIDRFPFEPTASGIREMTNRAVMPVQWRGTAGLHPQKDELGNITHYSANQSLLFDSLHSQITQQKLVLRGYTNHKETVIQHLCDMLWIEQPDSEAQWQKRTGADHFFHSMAFSKAARRISDHMYQSQTSSKPSAGSPVILGCSPKEQNLLGLSLKGIHQISRLG